MGLRQTLAFLASFRGPRRARLERLYEMIGTGSNLAERSLYQNFGYWASAASYDEAGAAMADLLGEAAGLGPTDRVLDVGFGFGDQDLRWAERGRADRIVGVNVVARQVSEGWRRVVAAGAGGRVRLLTGSATELPFRDASFDAVVSLEAALHFDTRERFLREARRVLRPGGRLALTDVVPRDGHRAGALGRVGERVGRRFWQIPEANVYGREVYVEKVAAAGFLDVRWRSIRDFVFEPFARYAGRRLGDSEVAGRMNPLMRAFFRRKARAEGYEAIDYALVSARAGESTTLRR